VSRLYTKEHEWLDIDGDIATVGITDYAQEALGDIVYIDLPEVGSEVEVEGDVCVVESVKAASDVYTPLSGEITEINESLSDEPELINNDPEGAAWMFKIKASNISEADEYMSLEQYKEFISEL
jgi:glycine cleavage system H protein